MPSKKQPEAKKILDVSRPKKPQSAAAAARAAAEAAPDTSGIKLVIPKRSTIISVAGGAPASPSEPFQANRFAKDLEPLSPGVEPDKTAEKPAEPKVAPVKAPTKIEITPDKPKSAPDVKPAAKPEPAPAPKPEPPKPAPKPEPKPEPEEEKPIPESKPDSITDDLEPKTDAKPDADVRKALEDAKRQEQIEGYIEKRQFFVPINAVARKRSIKVTLLLVFFELLLGLFLVNLMLDAGLIYLLEKVPHTNFFNLQ